MAVQVNNLCVGSAKVTCIDAYHLLMQNGTSTPKDVMLTFNGADHKNIKIDLSRKEAQKLIRVLTKKLQVKIYNPKRVKLK
jgi:hypothetical protein